MGSPLSRWTGPSSHMDYTCVALCWRAVSVIAPGVVEMMDMICRSEWTLQAWGQCGSLPLSLLPSVSTGWAQNHDRVWGTTPQDHRKGHTSLQGQGGEVSKPGISCREELSVYHVFNLLLLSLNEWCCCTRGNWKIHLRNFVSLSSVGGDTWFYMGNNNIMKIIKPKRINSVPVKWVVWLPVLFFY